MMAKGAKLALFISFFLLILAILFLQAGKSADDAVLQEKQALLQTPTGQAIAETSGQQQNLLQKIVSFFTEASKEEPKIPELYSVEWLKQAEVQEYPLVLAANFQETAEKENDRPDKIEDNLVKVKKPDAPQIVKIKSKVPYYEVFLGDPKSHLMIQYPTEVQEKLDVSLYDLAEIIEDGRYISAEGTIPVIVQFNEDVTLQIAKKTLSDIISKIPNSQILNDLKIINSVSARVDMAYVYELALDPNVKKVWRDRIAEIALDVSVPLINADDVWNKTNSNNLSVKGNGVKIAVIDTGIDYTHADLGGCTSAQFIAGSCAKVTKGKDFVNNDNDPMDDHGHGTHVAATAGGTGSASNGKFVGVAPEAEIWGVKVLSASGSGAWSQVISGIEWSTDPNGDGLFDDRADIISMSLGGGCMPCDGSDPVSQAVNRAFDRGTLPVVAAGNSGPSESTVGAPGVAEKALTVGASCKPGSINGYCNGSKVESLAAFSSRGPTSDFRIKPDITAPGVDICAAQWGTVWNDRKCGPKHVSISGTSMATPHVSGAAALIKQLHPNWSPQDIKSALTLSVVDIGYKPTEQGSGRMDVLRAADIDLIADKNSIAFRAILGDDNETIRFENFSVFNNDQNPVSIQIDVKKALRINDEKEYSIVFADRNNLTLQPNSYENITFILNLSSLDGIFEGLILLSTNNKSYHVPYSATRLSVINAQVVNNSGYLEDSYFILTDGNFNFIPRIPKWAKSHSIYVASGEYYLFLRNKGDAILKSNIIDVPVGGNLKIILNTNDTTRYEFRAFDINNNEIQAISPGYRFHILNANRSSVLTLSTRFLGSFQRYQSPVELYNVDLENSNSTSILEVETSGNDVVECRGLNRRNASKSLNCYFAFNSAKDFYSVIWAVENPSPSKQTTYVWKPENGSGPYWDTFDVWHDRFLDNDYLVNYWGYDFGYPYYEPLFMVAHPILAGLKRYHYYSNDSNTILVSNSHGPYTPYTTYQTHLQGYSPSVFASAFDETGHFTNPPLNTSIIGDASFYATPLELGRLLTNESHLRSTPYYIKKGQVYPYSGERSADLIYPRYGDSYANPRVSVYRDGQIFWKNRVFPWAYDLGEISDINITSGNFKIILAIPDIGPGALNQTYYFKSPSTDRTVPFIESIDYQSYFRQDTPFYISFIARDDFDEISSANLEYKGSFENIWRTAQLNQSGLLYQTAISLPTNLLQIDLKITLNDTNNNSIEYLFGTFSKAGVSIYPTTNYDSTAKVLSIVDCETSSGTKCPAINLKIFCGRQHERNGYIDNNGMPDLSINCNSTPTIKFDGSGIFMPFYSILSPSWHVLINGDDSLTKTRTVYLDLYCDENIQNITKVRYANEDLLWTSWGSYSASKEWLLSSGGGKKRVYYQCRTMQNTLVEGYDDITLDAERMDFDSPIITIIDPKNSSYVNATYIVLNVSANEPIDYWKYNINGGNNVTFNPNITILSFGDAGYYLNIYAFDMVGLVGRSNIAFVVDTIAPQGVVYLNTYTNTTKVTLLLICYPLLSNDCKEVQFSNDMSNFTVFDNYSSTKSWTLSSGDGTKTVYAKFKDAAGNVNQQPSYDTIILDTIPSTGTITISDGANYTNSTNVTLTLSCSDANNCSRMRFSNDSTTYSISETYATTSAWTLTAGDGTKTVYVKYIDNAGNLMATPATDTIILDTTAPTGTIAINDDAEYTASTSVVLSLSCSDSNNCSQMQFSNDGTTYTVFEAYAISKLWNLTSGDGTKIVYVKYTDAAGNTIKVNNTIILDITPPTITIHSPQNATYGSSIPLQVSANEPASSWQYSLDNSARTPFNPNTTINATEGMHSITVFAKDSTGNEGSSSVVFTVDTIPPTGTMNINNNANYTNTTSVILSLSCSDSNNCSQMQFSNDNTTYTTPETYTTTKGWTLSSGDGTKTVYVKFKDNAGNWMQTAVTDTIVLDTTAPTTATSAVSTQSGTNNWKTTDVAVALECQDASGCQRIEYRINNGSWATYGASITISTEGTNLLEYKSIDNAGNVGQISPSTYNIDKSDPVISNTLQGTQGNNGWYTTSVTVSLLPNDTISGIERTEYSLDGVPYATYTTAFVVSSQGSHSVNYRTYDKAGRTSNGSASFKIDTTAPTGTIAINDDAEYTASTSVILSLSCSDSNNCSQMQFSNDGTTYTVFEAYAISKLWNLTSGDGTKIVYVKYKDAAGNVGGAFSDTIILDTSFSDTAITSAPSNPTNDNAPTFVYSCTIAPCTFSWRVDNGTWSTFTNQNTATLGPLADGSHEFEVKSKTRAGNIDATPASYTFIVDTIPPTGTMNINNNANYTNTTAVTLTLSCTDANGCSQMQFSNDGTAYSTPENYTTSKTWALSSGDGIKTVYVKYKDAAGNVMQTAVSDTIILDTTGPTTATDSVQTQSGTNGWKTSDVTISLQCSDSGSGCSRIEYRINNGTWATYTNSITISTEGTSLLEYRSYDVAGNIGQISSATYRMDKTNPEISYSLSGTQGTNGWHTSAVTVALSPNDSVSGIDRTEYSFDNSQYAAYTSAFSISSQGSHTIWYRTYDRAGRTANGTASFKIDTTAPTGTIVINDNAEYTASTSVVLSLSCSDSNNCSQMQFSNDGTTYTAFEAYSISKLWNLTSGDGAKTVYVKYTDEAGNVGGSFTDSIILDTSFPDTAITSAPSNPTNDSTSAFVYSCTLAPCMFSHRIDNSTWSSYSSATSTTILTLADGQHKFEVKSKTSAGNEDPTPASYTFVVDTVEPTGAVKINSDDTYTTSTSVVLALTCNDASICTQIQISNDGIFDTEPFESFATTKNWNLTSGDGNKTVYAKFKDKAGNLMTTAATDTIILDTTGPETTISSKPTSPTNDSTPAFTFECFDTNTPCTFSWRIDNGIWSSYSSTTTATIVPLADGLHTFYLKAKDVIGNEDPTPASYTFVVDTIPPATNGTVNGTQGENSWFVSDVAVTLACSDASGCRKTEYRLNGGVWITYTTVVVISAEGTTTFDYRSIDNVDNLEIIKSLALKIDKTNPSITDEYSQDNIWVNSDQVVALTPQDPTSGINEVKYCRGSGCIPSLILAAPYRISHTAEGTEVVRYNAKDNAGRQSAIGEYIVKIDKTMPSGSVAINNNANYTNATNVTLTLGCTDSLSGCYQMQFSNDGTTYSTPETYTTSKIWTLLAGDGTKTVYVKFKDNAGNWVATAATDTIILDATPPETTASATNGNGSVYEFGAWTSSAGLDIVFNAQDPNIDKILYCADTTNSCNPSTIYTESFRLFGEGTLYLKYRSVDNAGNEETVKSKTINIDTLKPVTQINSPDESSWHFAEIAVSFADIDDGSGLNKCFYRVLDNNVVTKDWAERVCSEQTAIDSSTYCQTERSNSCTIEAYSTDDVNNNAETVSRKFSIDRHSPITTASALKADNANYQFDNWENTAYVDATLTAEDAGSGVSSIQHCADNDNLCEPTNIYGNPIRIDSEGITFLRYKAIDNLQKQEQTNVKSIKIDRSLPIGYILINNGAARTNIQAVDLNVGCFDQHSDIEDVRYANEDNVWTNWEQYTTIKEWILTLGDGTKTVKYQCRDDALNVAEFSDTIIVDSAGPSVTITKPLFYHLYVNDIDAGTTLAEQGLDSKEPTVAGKLTITADATDLLSPITKVEFLIDDALGHTDNLPPYEWTWEPGVDGLGIGHDLKVIAEDIAGNKNGGQMLLKALPSPVAEINRTCNSISANSDGSVSYEVGVEATIGPEKIKCIQGATPALTTTPQRFVNESDVIYAYLVLGRENPLIIIAPNGKTMTITQTEYETFGHLTGHAIVAKITLDGQVKLVRDLELCQRTFGNNTVTVEGDLTGSPVDGTWTMKGTASTYKLGLAGISLAPRLGGYRLEVQGNVFDNVHFNAQPIEGCGTGGWSGEYGPGVQKLVRTWNWHMQNSQRYDVVPGSETNPEESLVNARFYPVV